MRPMIKLIKVGQKLSLEELEDLLNQAYEAGFEDGKKESKNYYYPYYPYYPDYTRPYITWTNTDFDVNPYEVLCKEDPTISSSSTNQTTSNIHITNNVSDACRVAAVEEYLNGIVDSAKDMIKSTNSTGTVTFTKTENGFKLQDTNIPFDDY